MAEPRKSVTFEVPICPPSVNHYKKPVILRTSNGPIRSFARTPEADAFIQAIAIFARGRSIAPETSYARQRVRYALTCTVFLGEGQRGDGDNFFKCIADGLARAGVIHSDARVRTWHIDVEDEDRKNPRTLIHVATTERGVTLAERLRDADVEASLA